MNWKSIKQFSFAEIPLHQPCFWRYENGRMIFNCIDWPRDTKTPKIHNTQKPIPYWNFLIELFTDPNDVVIDPTAGSGSTLLAAGNLGRRACGFEVNKEFVNGFYEKLYPLIQPKLFV